MWLEDFLKLSAFNAQESLKGLVYHCLAIRKAVAIGARLQLPWRRRHLWGGDFATVAGVTRSGHSGLQGRVRFHLGKFRHDSSS